MVTTIILITLFYTTKKNKVFTHYLHLPLPVLFFATIHHHLNALLG